MTTRYAARHWSPHDQQDTVLDADAFARFLRDGGVLVPRATTAPLESGEYACAELRATVSRFYGFDEVAHEHRSVLATGSLFWAGVAALGNRRRRVAALAAARPQWRLVGDRVITVTSTRLVWWDFAGWESLWYTQLDGARSLPHLLTLDLYADTAAPLRLQSPGVPWLAVLFEHALGTGIFNDPSLTEV